MHTCWCSLVIAVFLNTMYNDCSFTSSNPVQSSRGTSVRHFPVQVWTQTLCYFYLGNNEQTVLVELCASPFLSNKQNLTTKHLGVFPCTHILQLKWKPKTSEERNWKSFNEVIPLYLTTCSLAVQAATQASFSTRRHAAFNRWGFFFCHFWCLPIYLIQSFSLQRTNHGTERMRWIQKVCKEYKIFLRYFYECDEQYHSKNQNLQCRKQPLQKRLIRYP